MGVYISVLGIVLSFSIHGTKRDHMAKYEPILLVSANFWHWIAGFTTPSIPSLRKQPLFRGDWGRKV